MKAYILQPVDKDAGRYIEDCCIFAARRCRTTKEHEDLWTEIVDYSDDKREKFLSQVIFQDWAADVLEMAHLMYDIEQIPMWMVVELLRHRLIAREFSIEQLSQRAINAGKLDVSLPCIDPQLRCIVDMYLRQIRDYAIENKLPPEDLRELYPQGIMVNLCISGNLRAFHHFFFMRNSPLFQGKGGAHKKFMKLSDQMYDEATKLMPILMSTLLRA